MKARGSDKYASGNNTKGVTFSSKNMLPLGIAVFAFLVLHIADFWWKMKVSHEMTVEASFKYLGELVHGENGYALVNARFQILWVVICYSIGSIALAYHLSHGFWSAFQTIGWNNEKWVCRLKTISYIYAIIVAGGFAFIPLYFLIKYAI